MDVEIALYLRKYKYLVKGAYQWNVVFLYTGLSSSIWFLTEENFYMVFRWG